MPSQLRVLKWKPIKLITQIAMQHKECVLKNFKINQQQMYVLWNKKKINVIKKIKNNLIEIVCTLNDLGPCRRVCYLIKTIVNSKSIIWCKYTIHFKCPLIKSDNWVIVRYVLHFIHETHGLDALVNCRVSKRTR